MPNDYFNPPNSIWPNALKKDDEGYAIFYPLGTNKVEVPTSSSEWPKGDKLVSPFVYQDDKLVGFVDTKALTVSKNTAIYLPYTHIEAEFSAIEKGQLQIHAPNATTKKASWKNSGVEYIPEAQFKYKGCKTVDDVKSVNADYQTTDIVNGVWSEPLWDLEQSGDSMFSWCTALTSFSSDLPNLTNGESMFSWCTALTSFSSDLPNLTNGESMFSDCANLTSFSSDLPNLTTGHSMFNSCTNLTSFTSDLSNLTNGYSMFNSCTNLTSFTSDLSNLTNGGNMFYGCSNLTSFKSDLSSLTNGGGIFYGCSNLTSFKSDLSSLTNGYGMFYSCKIDAESVMYIADTIKDITAEKQLYIDGTIPYVRLSNGSFSATRGFMSNGNYVYTYNNPKPYATYISALNVGKLHLGINVTNNTSTIQQQLEDFAKEATFETWADLKKHFTDKGWTVTFQYGGTTTSITYDIRNGEQIIPCQIFAKLVQVEDKDSAEYCTEDASTFYNIEWGHDVTDTSSYTQFDSLEDAMAYWNIFPKENIITTEE